MFPSVWMTSFIPFPSSHEHLPVKSPLRWNRFETYFVVSMRFRRTIPLWGRAQCHPPAENRDGRGSLKL
jgi:hypothetical protein